VIDAIRRSPIMLELASGHRGLDAIAGMPEDLVVDAVTYLVREVGWADAKNYIMEDASVLSEAADEVLVSAWGAPPRCMGGSDACMQAIWSSLQAHAACARTHACTTGVISWSFHPLLPSTPGHPRGGGCCQGRRRGRGRRCRGCC
jgi:hypothetical protein